MYLSAKEASHDNRTAQACGTNISVAWVSMDGKQVTKP